MVTNQPDVARGLVEIRELERAHSYLMENIGLAHRYACYHDESDDCPCRKPRPGMLLTAAKELGLDLAKSVLVGDKPFSPADMKGQVWLFNVWATWCVACREEHPILVAFSKANQLPIVGLSYKEVQAQDEPAGKKMTPEEKLQFARERSALWLKRHGNPYVLSAIDLDGRVGIDYGVYGVPETYVIDKEGVIRYKRVGVVTPELLKSTILPLVQKLNAS